MLVAGSPRPGRKAPRRTSAVASTVPFAGGCLGGVKGLRGVSEAVSPGMVGSKSAELAGEGGYAGPAPC